MIEIESFESGNETPEEVKASEEVKDEKNIEETSEEEAEETEKTEENEKASEEQPEAEEKTEEETEEKEAESGEEKTEEAVDKEATETEETAETPEEEKAEEEAKETVEAESSEEPEKAENQKTEKPEKKERGLKWAKGNKAKKESEEDKLKAQVAEINDKYVRLFAEFDNFRNRTEKEKTQRYDMGARDVVEKILPVIDNFERGFAAVEEADKEDAFVKGMDLVYKQFEKVLGDMGVKPIEAVGQPFNPDLHNAVMHVDDPEVGENIVVEEFQKGYTYKDQVVRYSMVKVAN